jgi:hypothetical protein
MTMGTLDDRLEDVRWTGEKALEYAKLSGASPVLIKALEDITLGILSIQAEQFAKTVW